ncbi:hypothetical protein EXE43_09605 [Halorubrum sp. SS5]|nr:hypothetical protein EXE43_09605 [Halorubrum sp. SS5]
MSDWDWWSVKDAAGRLRHKLTSSINPRFIGKETPAEEIHGESVKASDGTIGGLEFGRGVDQDSVGSLSDVNGSQVTVSADTFEPIIDKASAVDVISGYVVGTGATVLRVTWDDGSTDVIYTATFAQGNDNAGNPFTVIIVPTLESVTKVEFKNDLSSSSDFGYKILHS